jgi:hypothetical protein
MIVWPSLAASGYGRLWGRIYQNQLGFSIWGIPVTLGRIMALVSIPFILPYYFHTLVPRIPFVFFGKPNEACRRYRITDRRIVDEGGLGGVEFRSVALDRFDTIEIEVEPGQEWYHAGDLVFRQGNTETFRIQGISRPEAFRQACLKAQMAYTGVAKVLSGTA